MPPQWALLAYPNELVSYEPHKLIWRNGQRTTEFLCMTTEKKNIRNNKWLASAHASTRIHRNKLHDRKFYRYSLWHQHTRSKYKKYIYSYAIFLLSSVVFSIHLLSSTIGYWIALSLTVLCCAPRYMREAYMCVHVLWTWACVFVSSPELPMVFRSQFNWIFLHWNDDRSNDRNGIIHYCSINCHCHYKTNTKISRTKQHSLWMQTNRSLIAQYFDSMIIASNGEHTQQYQQHQQQQYQQQPQHKRKYL